MAGVITAAFLLAPVQVHADAAAAPDRAALIRIDAHNLIQWGIAKGYLSEAPSDQRISEREAIERFSQEGRAASGLNRFGRAERTSSFTSGDLVKLAYEACEGVPAREVTTSQLRTWGNQQGFFNVSVCNFAAPATRYQLMDVLYHLSNAGAEVKQGVMRAPYFNQVLGYYTGRNPQFAHSEWGNATFSINGHTLGVAGCGFAVTAMAISYCLDRIVAPTEFMENGQYTGDGAQHSIGVVTAQSYNLPVTRTQDFGQALAALRRGYPVMVIERGPSFWSQNGHYILMVGALPDGTIATYNPGLIEQTYLTNGKLSFDTAKITDTEAEDGAYTIFGLSE